MNIGHANPPHYCHRCLQSVFFYMIKLYSFQRYHPPGQTHAFYMAVTSVHNELAHLRHTGLCESGLFHYFQCKHQFLCIYDELKTSISAFIQGKGFDWLLT